MFKVQLITFVYAFRWGLVAAPHDVTGPPIDIALLSKKKEEDERRQYAQAQEPHHKHAKLATEWADGTDVEESLWWVSYAAQPRRYLSELSTFDEEKDPGILRKAQGAGEDPDGGADHGWTSMGKRDSAAQRAASDLVGEVEGEKLLLQLSKQALGAGKRRDEVVTKTIEFNSRVNRLAKVFQDESLRILQARMAGVNAKILTENEKKKRELSAARIQALVRGRKDRKLAAKMRAEQRVLVALQNLVNELSRPEMKSSGISLAQIDSTLLQRMATLNPGGNTVATSSSYGKQTKGHELKKQESRHAHEGEFARHSRLSKGAIGADVKFDSQPYAHAPPHIMHSSQKSDSIPLRQQSIGTAASSTKSGASTPFLGAVPSFEPLTSRSTVDDFDDSQFDVNSPSSPRSGAASQIQRMYRKRTKFGSDKESIAKLNKSKEINRLPHPGLIIETPEHESPKEMSPAKSAVETTPGRERAGSSSSSMKPSSSTRPGSSASRQIYTPSRPYLEAGAGSASSSAASGRSGGHKKKQSKSHATEKGDELLTEMEDSFDGYVSTPSVSQSGLADSMSSMFADFTGPKSKAIDIGSSAKNLQFDAVAGGGASHPSSVAGTPSTLHGSMQRSIQRPHSANSGPTSHISLKVPSLSRHVLQSFGTAADNYKKGQCKAASVIDSALLAKMTKFNKAAGLHLLMELVNSCGVEQLRVWLESFANSASTISLEASTGSVASEMSEAYRLKLPDLTLKSAAYLLVELGFQLNVLDDSDQSTYRLINLCMLLHLLSGGGSGRVKLAELIMLAEDRWLVESTTDGINVSFLLAQSRYSLLHEVIGLMKLTCSKYY
jgi:hypothetical protein